MHNAIKILTSTAVLAALVPAARADNFPPAKPPASMSSSNHHDGTENPGGNRFVWVQRIEGRDSAGNTQLLFSDRDGSLLALHELSRAGRLIDPLRVTTPGEYTELQLHLADTMLSIDHTGLKRLPLPPGITSQMVLRERLTIHPLTVSTSDLTLHTLPAPQVALAMP
jgi:hypothetical protein